jgi:hypothetical protein
MPTRRVILLAVMILSASGFLIDRVFFGEPAAASADPSAPDSRAPFPAPSKTDPTASEASATVDPSLDWLNTLEASTETPRNMFTPSDELLTYLDARRSQEDGAAQEQASENDPHAPARFEAAHTLQATFLGDEKMMAMIDGKVVRVGSVLDGYTIAHIESHQVECLRDGKRAILRMEMPLR